MTDCLKLKCSKCCQKIVIRIGEKVNADYMKWAEYHGLDIVFVSGAYYLRLDIPCQKLVDGKCSIEANKPDLCRAFDCNADGFKDFKFLL
jgi:Fe-S-cluster containining protein